MFEAAMGIPLTPEKLAAFKVKDAQSAGMGVDAAGNIFIKPRISERMGLGGLVSGGGSANNGAMGAPSIPYEQLDQPTGQGMDNPPAPPQTFSADNPVDSPVKQAPNPYRNPWDVEYEKQMRDAAGNVPLQQKIREAYSKSKLSMSESEGKNAMYADRMITAEKVLTDPNKIKASVNWWELTKDAINPFGNNPFNSEDYKSYKQAKLDAASARLRQESGASIAPSEYANDAAQLYPQLGEGPDVIAQKERNREAIRNGLMRAAGPAYQPPSPVVKDTPNLTKAEIEKSILNAQQAVKRGKRKAAVRQVLIDAGIDPKRAGL